MRKSEARKKEARGKGGKEERKKGRVII